MSSCATCVTCVTKYISSDLKIVYDEILRVDVSNDIGILFGMFNILFLTHVQNFFNVPPLITEIHIFFLGILSF